MNKILFFVWLIIIQAAAILAQPAHIIKGSEWCSMKKSQSNYTLKSKEMRSSAPRHSYDVLNYDLEMDIFSCYQVPYSKYFKASNEITFRVDSALSFIRLNAENYSLIIDSVSAPAISFTHSDNWLTLLFGQTLQPGEEASVKVYYTHKNVNDNAFFALQGFVFTDNEPQGARRWFPCWDQPSDKATMSLKARVPTNVKLGSNGRLEDSTFVDNALIYHWVSIHPIATYLMSISSRVNYKLDIVYWPKLSDPGEYVPIRFYYNSNENPVQIQNMIGEMTTVFSEAFCEHPFEKNGFATLNNQFVWGGMENQTLTNLCPGCWYESLVAHEYMHQWFGDMITCATWADLFINEAFATWGEAFWYEHRYGYEAYHTEIKANASYYLNNNPGWAISDPAWAVDPPPNNVLFNYAITYLKASCVMHQLRYVLGDSLFFAGMKAYASDTVDYKYQSVTIGDFRDKMEEVSGQNLHWFFDQWVFLPNHPVYNNIYYINELSADAWSVRFEANQTQTNTVFFKMPLELKISFTSGTDTLIRFMNDSNFQSFDWIFDRQPTAVQFDPNDHIVLKQSTLLVGTQEITKPAPALISFHLCPNPFSEVTTIEFTVKNQSFVRLSVFDHEGREISVLVNELRDAGNYRCEWSALGLPPGMYVCRLMGDHFEATHKMIIVR